MTTAKRMARRRKELGISPEKVAKALGVSRSTIYRYESGDIEKLPTESLEPLARILKTTPAYLMGWEENSSNIFSIPGIEPLPETYKVPRLGTIACGKPILATENIDTFDDIANEINCDFTLLCSGDSMIDARINDGDIVYIREQADVYNGEIAAVIIDDVATLKRVYRQKNRMILRAANPLYEDLEYEGEKLNEINIIGKAVGFTSLNIK